METKMANQKARAGAEPCSDASPNAGCNNLSASSKCLLEAGSGKMILHLYSSGWLILCDDLYKRKVERLSLLSLHTPLYLL